MAKDNRNKIINVTTYSNLYGMFPDIAQAITNAVETTRKECGRRGITSSMSLDEGRWKMRNSEKKWKHDFLYEDHYHEEIIRLEFILTYGHEPHRPMSNEISQILDAACRDEFEKIGKSLKQAAMMYGDYEHWATGVSSNFVCIFIKRE